MFVRVPTRGEQTRTFANIDGWSVQSAIHRHQKRIEMNATTQPRGASHLRTAVGLTGVLVLCACASTPPPTASLQEARHAIATAEQAEAGRYASSDLSDARANLASADTAVSTKNMIVAQRLAEESTADAELATAKTANIKANAVNNEMKRSTATLIEEMQRSSGDPQ
jgi:hypothetical protein